MSNIATALSGLQNVSLAIDTVSNNIANANTVGYKSGEYIFATQFLNGRSSSDQSSTGQGTQTLGVRRPMTQGAITNSANSLDLAISGKGMFRLLQGSGSVELADPSAVYYSRNGQFGVDKNGYIVNENGMFLTGYQPSLDGTQITDDLIKNNGLLRMPDNNLPGSNTSNSTLSAMLDSTGTAFTETANVSFDPITASYNNKTTQTVFDNSGNSHTLEVYYRRITDSTLSIMSGASGYTYTPSTSASPNTLGTTNVTLNKESVLRVNTSPVASSLVSVASNATSITLTAAPSKASTSVIPLTNMKVFVNGVDSGITVGAYTEASTSLPLSGALNVPAGASITLYDPDVSLACTAIGATASTLLTLSTSHADVKVGDKLYLGTTASTAADTGVTVVSKSAASPYTVTLSSAIASTGYGTGVAAVFKHPLSMTLVTPDGTEIPVTGATNKKTSGEILTTTTSEVEVYASMDGNFYDYQDSSTFSNRAADPETQGANGTGYKTVAKLSFMGGQNIDAIVKDSLSGDPMFKSTTLLTSRVTNQAGGSSDLIFNLDLSGTQLHAGAFQITKSTQNGEAVARLTNVTVDNAGRIVGVYGSGKQQFIGQVAMVNFDNEEGLIPVGKNAFAASNITGTEQDGTGVTVGRAGTGVLGEIRSQALESSNVDLANELVRLMILQRSYSANSQSLKAVDQTLRDTLQLVG